MIRLEPAQYDRILGPLGTLKMNTLFAESVLLQDVDGTVYVDRVEDPQVFYIAHGYGMSLLWGDMHQPEFNEALRKYWLESEERQQREWLQVYPDGWNDYIRALIKAGKGNIEEHTRVNFRFDAARYRELRITEPRPGLVPVPTDKKLFEQAQGAVVPRYFWRDAEQFVSKGIGFSLILDGQAAATAFAAFNIRGRLEIGIETVEAYRGQGLARIVCTALIDYCLAHGLEPVWACRLGNQGSYHLAQQLGFVPTLQLPYYQFRNGPLH